MTDYWGLEKELMWAMFSSLHPIVDRKGVIHALYDHLSSQGLLADCPYSLDALYDGYLNRYNATSQPHNQAQTQ